VSSSTEQLPVTELCSSVFDAVDAKDSARFASFFADGGRITFGNAPALIGRASILAGTEQFLGTITALRHRIVHEWVTGRDTTLELSVTYTRLDGHDVTVPAAVIWTVDDDGLFADYRVFFDLTPVYA
jgi:hypothetical protein